MSPRALILVLLLTAAATARAEPPTLRFATIAPDGTAWARELKAWARDVERESAGQVKLKLYFGALAGDEPEMAERLHRGQLDGMFGSMYCYQLAPSLRVTLVVGLFQGRDEVSAVVDRLRSTIDKEFLERGFVNLGESGLGAIIPFSRRPIATMADLRRTRLLIWMRDDLLSQQLPLLGMTVVPGRLEDGIGSYLDGRADGFAAVPGAALAFQWSPHAKYFSDVRLGFIVGCGAISTRSFDALPLEVQAALRNASAKLTHRYEEMGAEQDQALMGGLFEKQGVKPVPVDLSFRAEFFDAARAARDKLSPKLASPTLLREVISLLSDYRAAHLRP
jgi:TRAP-type C4-dicarboxylate transport system substrate-binding protein